MNNFKALFLCVSIALSFSVRATCVGDDLTASGADKNTLLSTALANFDSFPYVRNQLDAWREAGATLCASGIPLDKNIYQYVRWFIQLEVRSPDGQLKALLPALFQTASVQAHENAGPKPWVVMPNVSVQEILGKMQFVAQEKYSQFPKPTEAGFKTAVQASSWARSFDADSFSVTPLAEPGLYLAGWLTMVAGTGGNVFTEMYTPKIVLIRYLTNGGVEIDHSHSGWGEVLSPLDSLLSSLRRPRSAAEELELVQRFSALK